MVTNVKMMKLLLDTTGRCRINSMATDKTTKKPKWKSFEESAKQASSKIFSTQSVKPDQKVMGTISQVLRQIDIKVGGEEFIDIECKDHSKPVDLPIVEQFA